MDATHPRVDDATSPSLERAVLAFTVLLVLTFISSARFYLASHIRLLQRDEFPSSVVPNLNALWYINIATPVLWGWFADRCSSTVVWLTAFAAESLLFVLLALIKSGWASELDHLALYSINLCWLPVGASLIATRFSQRRRSFLISLVLCANILGLNVSTRVLDQFGWRAVAIAFGFGPMVIALTCLLFSPGKQAPSHKGSFSWDRALLVPFIAYALAFASAQAIVRGYWAIKAGNGGIDVENTYSVPALMQSAAILAPFVCWFADRYKDPRRSQSNRRMWSILLAIAASGAAAWVWWAPLWPIVWILVFFSSTIAFRAVQCASLSTVGGAAYSGRLIGIQVSAGMVLIVVFSPLLSDHPAAAWPVAILLIIFAGLVTALFPNKLDSLKTPR